MKSPRVSLAALVTAQALVTFIDCAAKFMLIALARQLTPAIGWDPQAIVLLVGVLLVLPYVAFAPVCGSLSDRFSKHAVFNAALILQIATVALLVPAAWGQSFGGALGCFFLLSVQTAMIAPAKRGILLEYLAPEKLSRYVGYLEGANIAALAAGAWAGGWLFSRGLQAGATPWMAVSSVSLMLGGLAVVAWLGWRLAVRTPAQSAEPMTASVCVRHARDLAEIWRDKPMWRSALGIGFAAGMGSYVMLALGQVVREQPEVGLTFALPGAMLLLAGLGGLVGTVSAGLFSRRGVEMGLASIGGLLLCGCLASLSIATPPPSFAPLALLRSPFAILLIGSGFSLGLAIVPLYAFVQQRAADARRGRVLASIGSLAGGAVMVAAGLYAVFGAAGRFAVGTGAQFFVLALVAAAMTVY
ncbi:MAG TPA: MFS transporter, partial [Acidobacteriota bacterium]|nr:MFS transporter [Acidobacteriota bacterium]